MKLRLSAALLAAVMLLAVIPAGTAFASSSQTAPVEVIPGLEGDYAPGDTVSLPVYISCEGEYEAHCIRFSVTYDPAMLLVTSVTPGEVWNSLPMDSMKMLNYRNPGSVDISVLCPTEGMTQTGSFVYINFVVGEDCRGLQLVGTTMHEFFFSPPETGAAEDIECVCGEGGIYVEAPVTHLHGDANDDGEVNYLDISYIYLFIIGESDLPPQGVINADFNGDGMVTYLDISDIYMFLIS